jgi:hypothetical protein
VVVASGVLWSLTALLVGIAGLAIACAAAWWFLAHRGIVRWLAGAVLVAVPVTVIAVYVAAAILLEIALSVVLVAVAVTAGRTALGSGVRRENARRCGSARCGSTFVIVNPQVGRGRSGSSGSGTGHALGAGGPAQRSRWWT